MLVIFGLWLGATYVSHSLGGEASALVQILFGLLVLVCGLTLAYPRRPRQISMALLALILGLSVWSLAAFPRSPSLQDAWRAASELLWLTCTAGLAAAFFTSPKAQHGASLLVAISALVLLAAAVWRFLAGDPSSMFSDGHLVYPVSWPSTAAGLYLVLLWPLLWLTVDQRERPLLRGIALGLAFGLGCLSYLTRSQAAMWAVGLTVPLAFLLTPARLRLLFYLLVPILLSVWAYPGLDLYRSADPATLGPRGAVFILIVGSVVCATAGIVLSLLERWIKVSDRMRIIFGLAVATLISGGLVYTQLTSPHLLEAPLSWAEEGVNQWLAAASPARSAFVQASITGEGAGQAEASTPMPVRLAADLGVVGIVLSGLALLVFLFAVLWPRLSAGWHLMRSTWLTEDRDTPQPTRWGADPEHWGMATHILLSTVLWLSGSSIDGSWLSAHSALPMLLLVLFALAQIDSYVDTAFPKLARAVSTAAARAADPTSLQQVNPEAIAGTPDTTAEREARVAAFSGLPRAHRHLERRRRLERRRALRARKAQRYRPPGPLTFTFRVSLVVLSALLLLMSVPEAMHDAALRVSGRPGMSPESSLTWAARAGAVFPISPAALARQGEVLLQTADRAQESTSADRHAALLDNLALAVLVLERASDIDPTRWATLHAAALSLERMAKALPAAGNPASLFAPGEAALSQADSPAQIESCIMFRALPPEALLARARFDAALALDRAPANPLLTELAARLQRAADD